MLVLSNLNMTAPTLRYQYEQDRDSLSSQFMSESSSCACVVKSEHDSNDIEISIQTRQRFPVVFNLCQSRPLVLVLSNLNMTAPTLRCQYEQDRDSLSSQFMSESSSCACVLNILHHCHLLYK